MANVFSTLAQGKKPLTGVLVISLIYAVHKARQQFKNKMPLPPTSNKKKYKKVGVNAEFFEQMKKLLPICVPGTVYTTCKLNLLLTPKLSVGNV